MNGTDIMLNSGLAFVLAIVASVVCVAVFGIRKTEDKGIFSGILIGAGTYLYATFVWEMPGSFGSALLIVVAGHSGWRLYSGSMHAWLKRLEISALEARLSEPVDRHALLDISASAGTPINAPVDAEELPKIVIRPSDVNTVKPYGRHRWE